MFFHAKTWTECATNMRIICHGLAGEDFPVEFVNHEISLGTGETNGIVIAEGKGVSDCHAFLVEDGDALFIRDNGSSTGTFLNHSRIQAPGRISSGDIVQIGDREIRVEFHPVAADDIDRTIQTVMTISDVPAMPEMTVTLNFHSTGMSGEKTPDVTAMTMMPDGHSEQNAAEKESDREESASSGSGDYDKTMISSGTQHSSVSPSSVNSTPLPAGLTSTQAIFISGREIGKYIIIKRIGKGGMGEVYLAKHKTLGTYRALKVLPREFLEDNEKFLDRFIREAKLASEIRHPNVVGVMDVETDTEFGCPYIVMEYIDGGSLRSILKSTKTLSEEQAVVIVEAIASALRAAERFSIVHRDIKPDNIMFTKQGEVKLADLGIAKNEEMDNELTRTNVMIGTPAYLSPEQAQNAKGVDARADIYSLGATFYEMLTGEHPYPGHNTFEILHKLFADPVPDPRKINPEVSPASAAIVMKMIAKEAKDRFQNATELLETMDRTFPPHTAYESAELIKKVIAGDTENNTAFSSAITTMQFGWRYKKIVKWIVLTAIVAIVLCGGGIGAFMFLKARNAVPPLPAAATPAATPATAPATSSPTGTGGDEVEPSSPPPQNVASSPSVEEKPEGGVVPVQESLYELQIRTTPDSEIHFISEDGQMRVYSSNRAGLLRIPGLKPGTYRVNVSRGDYHPLSREVELKEDTDLDMPLTADFKQLVVNALPGSEIRVEGVKNGKKTMTVPENGSAVFPELLGEALFVHIELPGWETYEQTLLLTGDMEFQARQNRVRVSLTVRTAPYSKIVLKQDGKEIQSFKANSMGMAVADGIASGDYRLEISSEGYHTREMACDLNRNQNLIVDLQKITYELRIEAAPDTRVMLFLNHQLQGDYRVPASGDLNLPEMIPGKYSITAEKKGMVSRDFDIDLDKDLSLDCHLVEEVAVTPPADKPFFNEDGTIKPVTQTKEGIAGKQAGNEAANLAAAAEAATITESEPVSDQIRQRFAEELRILNDNNMKRETIKNAEGSMWYCQGIYNEDLPGKPAILVFLHGIGARGNENLASIRLAVPDIVRQIKDARQKVILLVPQCPSNQTWTPLHLGGSKAKLTEKPAQALGMVPILIQKKIKEFDADPDRVYITGLSMGGYGTWDLIARYGTDLFAAAMPCCGGGDPARAEKLKDLPIWIFHGEADSTVPVMLPRRMYTALKEAGSDNVFYKEYPGVQLDCWTQTYRNPEVWKWLFSQKRGVKSDVRPEQGEVVKVTQEEFDSAGGFGQVAQQDRQEQEPRQEETAPDTPPAKQEGTVTISLTASPELSDYLRKNGVSIKIGEETWSGVREFPWSQKLAAGEYAISVQADGIRDLNIPQFTVKADGDNACKLEPVALPSYLQFVSNFDDAKITINGSAFKPGQEVECDTFREIAVVGVHGKERLSKTVRSTKPGKKIMVEFLFKQEEKQQSQGQPPPGADKPPMQAEYEQGMKLFADKKYKDALKMFTPAAEAGNVNAALKIAEINERGLGMWFSDSKEAMKWYATAAKLGSPEAALKVAQAIDNGDYKGTAKEMLDYYLKACVLNQADVFYRISNLYKTGYKEIPQNDAKSIDYLRKAAELGLPDAMFDLGIRYEKGDGVVSNSQTAMEWIKKAADAGYPPAEKYIQRLKQ